MLEQNTISTSKADHKGISLKKAMFKLIATETQVVLDPPTFLKEKDDQNIEKPSEIKNSESILTEQFIESTIANFIDSMAQLNAKLEILENSLENYENERLVPTVDSAAIPKKLCFLIEFLTVVVDLSALIKQFRSTLTDIEFRIQTAPTSIFGSSRGKKAVIRIFNELRDNYTKLEAAANSHLLIFKNSNQKTDLTHYERSILANAARNRSYCFTELYKLMCTNPKLSFKEVAQFIENSKIPKSKDNKSYQLMQEPKLLSSKKTKSFSSDLNLLRTESKTALPNHSSVAVTPLVPKHNSGISILHKNKLRQRTNKKHNQFDFFNLKKPQQNSVIKPIEPIELLRSNTSPLLLTSIFTKPDHKKELALLKKNLKHCQNPQQPETGLNNALEKIEARLESLSDSITTLAPR